MAPKTKSARRGQILTVGFHNANPPLIWRLDLEQTHTFSMILQGAEGDWDLGMTSPRGEFTPVAHFSAREDAEDAFDEVEAALSAVQRGPLFRFFKGVLYACILLIAVGEGIGLYKYLTELPAATKIAAPVVEQKAAPAAPEPGKPVSADDVLQAPAE